MGAGASAQGGTISEPQDGGHVIVVSQYEECEETDVSPQSTSTPPTPTSNDLLLSPTYKGSPLRKLELAKLTEDTETIQRRHGRKRTHDLDAIPYTKAHDLEAVPLTKVMRNNHKHKNWMASFKASFLEAMDASQDSPTHGLQHPRSPTHDECPSEARGTRRSRSATSTPLSLQPVQGQSILDHVISQRSHCQQHLGRQQRHRSQQRQRRRQPPTCSSLPTESSVSLPRLEAHRSIGSY